jgi:hypothetical protein
MAWCLTVSGSVAVAGATPVAGAAEQSWSLDAEETGEPARLVDPATGIVLEVEQRPSGVMVMRATGHGLDVQKTVSADGAFTLSIRSTSDLVVLSGNRGRIKVARKGRSVALETRRPNEAAYQDAAAVLAGSPAIRLFRAALSQMTQPTLESLGGVALQLCDVFLSVLQYEPTAVARMKPGGQTSTGLPALIMPEGESCFESWRDEALSAWSEYESCYRDFRWWSGGREGCAFLYIIQVESAWFKLLSCSAIKIG